MWLVQFRPQSGAKWFTVYEGKKNTALLIKEKKEKEFPRYVWRLVEKS
jgi:hypothetical protein